MNTLNGNQIGNDLQIYDYDIKSQLDSVISVVNQLRADLALSENQNNALKSEVDRLDAQIVTLKQQLADCEGTPLPPPPDPGPPAETYFANDFEGCSLSNSGTGQMQINGFGLNELSIANSKLNFIAGNNTFTPCAIENDPTGSGKKVLMMSVKDDDPNHPGTSRAQLDISFDASIKNQDILHFSRRVYLHPDIAHMVNIPNFHQTWFTLEEFWYDGASGENPAGGGRITLYVKEAVAGKLNLRAEMQRTPTSSQQTILWREDNLPFVIPFGKWFTMDTYLKRGEGVNGNYKLTITEDGKSPVVVFDIKKTTYLPDAPSRRCNYFAPFKLYGGDGPLYDAMRNANKQIKAYYQDLIWFKS